MGPVRRPLTGEEMSLPTRGSLVLQNSESEIYYCFTSGQKKNVITTANSVEKGNTPDTFFSLKEVLPREIHVRLF